MIAANCKGHFIFAYDPTKMTPAMNADRCQVSFYRIAGIAWTMFLHAYARHVWPTRFLQDFRAMVIAITR